MILFSQNDPAWKSIKMGLSNCTLGNFGCTTSCIATGGTWFGETFTPGELAKKLTYTKDGLIIWQSIEKVYKSMKFHWRFYKYDQVLIDQALKDPNKVVLFNVNHGKHWVFGLNKVPFIGYRAMDPYPFPSKKRFYSPAEIVGWCILTKK